MYKIVSRVKIKILYYLRLLSKVYYAKFYSQIFRRSPRLSVSIRQNNGFVSTVEVMINVIYLAMLLHHMSSLCPTIGVKIKIQWTAFYKLYVRYTLNLFELFPICCHDNLRCPYLNCFPFVVTTTCDAPIWIVSHLLSRQLAMPLFELFPICCHDNLRCPYLNCFPFVVVTTCDAPSYDNVGILTTHFSTGCKQGHHNVFWCPVHNSTSGGIFF